MKEVKGKVVFDGAAAEPKGFSAEVESDIPALPTANGTYTLHIENGVATWVAEN